MRSLHFVMNIVREVKKCIIYITCDVCDVCHDTFFLSLMSADVSGVKWV